MTHKIGDIVYGDKSKVSPIYLMRANWIPGPLKIISISGYFRNCYQVVAASGKIDGFMWLYEEELLVRDIELI